MGTETGVSMTADDQPAGEKQPGRKRGGGGGQLNRTAVIGVRLDPKLKYLADLAARIQRRTLSSYIEWAIAESLHHVFLREPGSSPGDKGTSVAVAAEFLWDVDEAERFARLAFLHPTMLTHEEQVVWKLVRENGYLWKGKYSAPAGEWNWEIRHEFLHVNRLREHWNTFKAVASGRVEKSKLPKWEKKDDPPPKKSSDLGDIDDQIPT